MVYIKIIKNQTPYKAVPSKKYSIVSSAVVEKYLWPVTRLQSGREGTGLC